MTQIFEPLDDYRSLTKQRMAPGLWLVATPIGNLADISFRALEVLRRADLILAEDTRVAKKLLSAFGLKKHVERADENATEQAAQKAISAIGQGQIVAFVADAGSPAVADPGQRLARHVIDAGQLVTGIPGPSAAIMALMLSGFINTAFSFLGFVPAKAGARDSFLKEANHYAGTLIFFETGPRLAASLAAMATLWPDRRAMIGRELTKLYEETKRGTLQELANLMANSPQAKGEIVLVLEAQGPQVKTATPEDLDGFLQDALTTHSTKDASSMAFDAFGAALGLKKQDIYKRAQTLKDKQKGQSAG